MGVQKQIKYQSKLHEALRLFPSDVIIGCSLSPLAGIEVYLRKAL